MCHSYGISHEWLYWWIRVRILIWAQVYIRFWQHYWRQFGKIAWDKEKVHWRFCFATDETSCFPYVLKFIPCTLYNIYRICKTVKNHSLKKILYFAWRKFLHVWLQFLNRTLPKSQKIHCWPIWISLSETSLLQMHWTSTTMEWKIIWSHTHLRFKWRIFKLFVLLSLNPRLSEHFNKVVWEPALLAAYLFVLVSFNLYSLKIFSNELCEYIVFHWMAFKLCAPSFFFGFV